jgi:flagellar P-ring protein precursor FlgI
MQAVRDNSGAEAGSLFGRVLSCLLWAVSPCVAAIVLSLLLASPARATSVKEVTRIAGQGESVLRGVGLVVGLAGTGDEGKDLIVARPLAALLQSNGMLVTSIDELAKSKAAALVSVTITVPREGARSDDKLDVSVSVLNTAKSLAGGELYITAMQGPLPGSGVYAIAQGKIELENAQTPTTGRVRGGGRMIRDILMPEVGDSFELIIEPPYAGWPSANAIAAEIQGNVALEGRAYPSTPRVATAIDERTIRVIVPPEERENKAAFIADVLGSSVKMELLDLPAQVIMNARTGAIIVTGDVRIAPVAITHKDLTITTTVPAVQPTAQNPAVRRERWTSVGTEVKAPERARLTDLLDTFKQLDVPVQEQINIIQMLHKTGKLEAKLVMD